MTFIEEVTAALAAANIEETPIAARLGFLKDLIKLRTPSNIVPLMERHGLTFDDLDELKMQISSLETDMHRTTRIFSRVREIPAVIGADTYI